MKLLQRLLGCLLFLTIPCSIAAAPVTIATWNIEHLRMSNLDGPTQRKDADFNRLKSYALKLGADIVALQEIEGPAAARRVFPASMYNYFFTARQNPMQTGFAVKRHLNVLQNPDYEDLQINDETFTAADLTVILDQHTTVRLLSVHLKSGCWGDALTTDSFACKSLSKQVDALERWIDARAAAGEPYIVLGDFNRRFDLRSDTFWPEIDDGMPAGSDLTRVTAGRIDRCWNSRYPKFIDHIVLDHSSARWIVRDSFRQLVYTESTRLQKKLSDHCPISVIIDPALTGKNTQKDIILMKIDLIEQQLEELRQLLDGQEK